jgi:hypothetical protein
MSHDLIPSFKPQISNKATGERQPIVSQETVDRIAIAQEAYRWGDRWGPYYGKWIFRKLDKPRRKTVFWKTITEFTVRIYKLKLEHELIIEIIKIIALLILAGLFHARRLLKHKTAQNWGQACDLRFFGNSY